MLSSTKVEVSATTTNAQNVHKMNQVHTHHHHHIQDCRVDLFPTAFHPAYQKAILKFNSLFQSEQMQTHFIKNSRTAFLPLTQTTTTRSVSFLHE